MPHKNADVRVGDIYEVLWRALALALPQGTRAAVAEDEISGPLLVAVDAHGRVMRIIPSATDDDRVELDIELLRVNDPRVRCSEVAEALTAVAGWPR